MKLMLAFFLLSQSAYAIDVGDGSDGVCSITASGNTQITAAKKNYQCTRLELDGTLTLFNGSSAGAGGAALVIKVQNDVVTVGTFNINLDGAPGVAGDTVSGKAGGLAGAGGGAGGNSFGTGVDGNNGNNSGGGVGGKFVTPFTTSSYGGGGGGGSFKTQGATQPTDGDDVGGTAPTSKGTNGTAFSADATIDSSFTGGSGGAAGGDGKDTGVFKSGSSGGGGGGAIRIVAGGDITLNGTISVRGGNGGGVSATTYSGGGGGGSGGAILIQAGRDLIVNGGTLEARGGTFGENDFAGFGGDGGNGIIRLDDRDGVVDSSAATVNPGKSSFTFSTSAQTSGSSAIRSYASEVSCASVALDDHARSFTNLVNLILGMATVAFIHLVASKRSKI